MSEAQHIFQIAKRTGGQSILAACGEDGSDQLRDAIAAYAADGGVRNIKATIESLFGNDDSALTDSQLGELGAALVENWRA